MVEMQHEGAGQLALLIFGIALGCAFLSTVLLVPFLYQRLMKDDWRLRWYDFLQGPLLLQRGRSLCNPRGHNSIPDYYEGHKTKEELALRDVETSMAFAYWNGSEVGILRRSDCRDAPQCSCRNSGLNREVKEKWYGRKHLKAILKRAFYHGVGMDVAKEQINNPSLLCRDLERKHAEASRYDNKAEHAFSYLQVLTAATASFANGANDISK